ncbi:hypothetical protein QWJ90_00015 [Microbacterium oryzae]|uniref:hypothetical protein n=1 Tax=Microbacterium oryzae TaxID=743009 RepID=UPI0025AFA53B|nr:hypothetical protein [Microbacterium oryzae]MDN3309312.1 hypothetical protein [Microbacterium oryzae]
MTRNPIKPRHYEGQRVRLTGRAWGNRGREVYAQLTFVDGGFVKIDDQVVLSSGIPIDGYEFEVAPVVDPARELQLKAAALREAVEDFEANVGRGAFRALTVRPESPKGWTLRAFQRREAIAGTEWIAQLSK